MKRSSSLVVWWCQDGQNFSLPEFASSMSLARGAGQDGVDCRLRESNGDMNPSTSRLQVSGNKGLYLCISDLRNDSANHYHFTFRVSIEDECKAVAN